jgi:hypothetical protein
MSRKAKTLPKLHSSSRPIASLEAEKIGDKLAVGFACIE